MMNKDEIGGNWKQFKGKAKEQWGKLTDDDMTVIEGKRDQLVGKIQERYGFRPPFLLLLTRLFFHQNRVVMLTLILMSTRFHLDTR